MSSLIKAYEKFEHFNMAKPWVLETIYKIPKGHDMVYEYALFRHTKGSSLTLQSATRIPG